MKFSAIILRLLVPWPSTDNQGKFCGDRLRGTPPSGGLNARGVAKYSDFHLWYAVHPKRCKIGGKLVLITNRKSYMSFRLVPKSVTLNDLERRNGPYFVLFFLPNLVISGAYCVNVADKAITMDNLRLLCLVVNVCGGTRDARCINSRLNAQYLPSYRFDKNSYMSFRLVPISAILNDLERRNAPYFALFYRICVRCRLKTIVRFTLASKSTFDSL